MTGHRYVAQGDSHQVDAWPPADVVVTDPPFGVGKTYAGVLEHVTYTDHVARVLAIAGKVGVRVAVIRGPSPSIGDPALPRPTRTIAECRTFVARSRVRGIRYAWTPWYVYGALEDSQLPDWFTVGPVHGGIRDLVATPATGEDHPGLTPAPASAAILARSTSPGDVVLDPFAGLGGIGVMALRSGRGYAGVELDPAWALRAEERCVLAAEGATIPLPQAQRRAPTSRLWDVEDVPA